MEPGIWRDEEPAKAAETERPVKIMECLKEKGVSGTLSHVA